MPSPWRRPVGLHRFSPSVGGRSNGPPLKPESTFCGSPLEQGRAPTLPTASEDDPAPFGCVRPGLRATRPMTTAVSDPERFGPVAPAPCPSRTAVPIGQRSATRAIACSGPGCPGPTPVPCTGPRPRSARSRSNPRSVSVERADRVHAPVGRVHSLVGAVATRRVRPVRTRRGEGAVTIERTVLVVEADGFAVLGALENPPPVIAEPVFEFDTDDQVRIAVAIGLAAAPSPA